MAISPGFCIYGEAVHEGIVDLLTSLLGSRGEKEGPGNPEFFPRASSDLPVYLEMPTSEAPDSLFQNSVTLGT